VDVTLARYGSIAGLVLAVISAIAIVLIAARADRSGVTRLSSRYDAMLVDISDPEPAMAASGQVVVVRSFDDLARLAERDGQVILRHAANGIERFIVRCADITYQYSANPGVSR
jgi:hypothetical protein